MNLRTKIGLGLATVLLITFALAVALRPNYQLVIAPTGVTYRIDARSGRVWMLLPGGDKWMEIGRAGVI